MLENINSLSSLITVNGKIIIGKLKPIFILSGVELIQCQVKPEYRGK